MILCSHSWAHTTSFKTLQKWIDFTCYWIGQNVVIVRFWMHCTCVSLSATVKQIPGWNNARLVCNSAKTLKDTILTAVTPLLQTSDRNSSTDSVQLLPSLVVCWLISLAAYLILVLVSLDKQTWGWEMEEPETSLKNRSPMTIIENGGRTEKSQKRKGERQT